MNTVTAIVVPCYNEEKRLDSAVIRQFLADNLATVSLLFVDDGSTDNTAGLLDEIARQHPNARVLRLQRNGGKAEAVRQGMLTALATNVHFAGYWDADLATPFDALSDLTDLLQTDERLRMVMGSRVALLGRDINRHASRHYAGRVIATAASLTLGVPVYDTQCGAKLFRAGPETMMLFQEPFRSRWMFDVELIARLLIQTGGRTDAGTFIREHPLQTWHHVAGSKVTLMDGVRALFELARIRMDYGRSLRTG